LMQRKCLPIECTKKTQMIKKETKKIADDRYFAYTGIHKLGVAAVVCISKSERNDDGKSRNDSKSKYK
jgi:hypothetical protein